MMRYTQLNRIGFYCAQGSHAKPVGRENHEREKICNICGICVEPVCVWEMSVIELTDTSGCLADCVWCVISLYVCWMSYRPPRDRGCDHMLTMHPDRCDKCSNTSVSKRRVCNFLEGPLRDGCCDIHSKWEMDGQCKRERKRQKITGGIGNTGK